jgi:hypothetical protein
VAEMKKDLLSNQWIEEKTKTILDEATFQIKKELQRREKKGIERPFNYFERQSLEDRYEIRRKAIYDALERATQKKFMPLFALIKKDKSILFDPGVKALILKSEKELNGRFFKGLGSAVSFISKPKAHLQSWEVIGIILDFKNGQLLHLIQAPRGFKIFLQTITSEGFPLGEFIPDAWREPSYLRKQLKRKGFLKTTGVFGQKKAEKVS